MKKLTRILALALLLSMTVCLLPASAKNKPIEYEWLYSYDEDIEDTYSVQVGSWRLFNGAKKACELLRSYGYEAFIYFDNNYRVCVGLWPDYDNDSTPVDELIEDLKTLTRDSEYLAACATSFVTEVKVPEEAEEKFSAYGAEMPKATAEPKRTKAELCTPSDLPNANLAPTMYVKNSTHAGWAIYMYYGITDEYGICGFVGNKQPVKLLGVDGAFSYIRTADQREGWVNTCMLTGTKP